jgi:EKC/KEOPS complex subunit CGI121/TPRKB
VEGIQVPFADDGLQDMTDLARVRKIYKLNTTNGGGKKTVNGINGTNEVGERKEVEILVLGSMALRGATN